MASEWTCSQCTFVNPEGNQNCGVCAERKDKCVTSAEGSEVFDEGDYEKSYGNEQRRESGGGLARAIPSLLTRIKRFFTSSRAPPPPKRWVCPTCTYSNNDILRKCEMCGVEKPRERRLIQWSFNVRPTWSPPSAEGGQPEKRGKSHAEENRTWVCSHCNFSNNYLLPKCEVCLNDSPRTASVSHAAQGDSVHQPPLHHVTSIYDNDPDVAVDDEAFEFIPSLPVSGAQLDSPTQLLTGEFCVGRSLSVRERRRNDEDEAAVQRAAIVQFCRKVRGDKQSLHGLLAFTASWSTYDNYCYTIGAVPPPPLLHTVFCYSVGPFCVYRVTMF